MSGCVSCGDALREGAKFCRTCGAPQAGRRRASRAAPSWGRGLASATSAAPRPRMPRTRVPTWLRPTISRRVTSVLFGDLVGFTSLSESRDQEDMRELLSRYFEECRRIVGRYGGTIEKFIGDAVMAVWGVPDGARGRRGAAVRAGLELVVGRGRAAARASGSPTWTCGSASSPARWRSPSAPRSRAWSPVTRSTPRRGSSGAAAPGQVWVDETTRLLTSSAITYRRRGRARAQGQGRAGAAVVGARRGRRGRWRAARRRPRGAVGRAGPRAAPGQGAVPPRRGVADARRCSSSRARPGIGKSRLAWEFEKYVDGLTHGRAVALGPLRVVRRGRRVLRLGRGDPWPARGWDVRTTTEALAVLHRPEARDLCRATSDERDLAAAAARGAARHRGRRELHAGRTCSRPGRRSCARVGHDGRPGRARRGRRPARRRGAAAFLEHLLDRRPVPVLRGPAGPTGAPGRQPGAGGATAARPSLHLDELLGRRTWPGCSTAWSPACRATCATAWSQRAEGVPLYAVEIVRSLIDRDLVLPRGGQYVLADAAALDLEAVGAPASLQTLVAARLDALDAGASAASCAGRACSARRSRRSRSPRSCPDVDLEGVLRPLVRLQILRLEDSRLSAERRAVPLRPVRGAPGRLRHAVAARPAGRCTWRSRHSSRSSGRSGELAPVIAQHYLEAVRAAPDDETTRQLVRRRRGTVCAQAAERARGLGAPAEAAAHLARRAVAWSRTPRQRAEIGARPRRTSMVRAGQLRGRRGGTGGARWRSSTQLGDDVEAGFAAAPVARALQLGTADHVAALDLARARYQRSRDVPGADPVLLTLLQPINRSMSRLPVGEHRGPRARRGPAAPGGARRAAGRPQAPRRAPGSVSRRATRSSARPLSLVRCSRSRPGCPDARTIPEVSRWPS